MAVRIKRPGSCVGRYFLNTKTARQLLLFTLVLLVASTAVAGENYLADLASTLGAGQWALMTGSNLSGSMTSQEGDSIMNYSDDMEWDPVTNRVIFIGGTHGGQANRGWLEYDADTNTWARYNLPVAWHAYNHNAIDLKRRRMYHRYGGDGVVFWKPIDGAYGSSSWASVGTYCPSPDAYCGADAMGLEYFPDIDRVVAFDSKSSGNLRYYNADTNSWSNGPAHGYPDTYHNEILYNPVYHIMAFGGGNAGRGFRKLTADGTVSAMASAPASWGAAAGQGRMTVDPVSGDFILCASGNIWKYSVPNDTWTQISSGGSALVWNYDGGNPMIFTAVTAIPDYGVIMFLTSSGASSPSALIYKHSTSSGPPPPPPPPTAVPNPPTSLLIE